MVVYVILSGVLTVSGSTPAVYKQSSHRRRLRGVRVGNIKCSSISCQNRKRIVSFLPTEVFLVFIDPAGALLHQQVFGFANGVCGCVPQDRKIKLFRRYTHCTYYNLRRDQMLGTLKRSKF